MSDNTTHFGFQSVPLGEKAERVREVFQSVASRYDLMNDLMSAGLHRAWKRHLVQKMRLQPGHSVLDIAGGTGDIARRMAEKVGPSGRVILSDINADMLQAGRARLEDAGWLSPITPMQLDGEQLPFADRQFDAITIAFGLRNMTNKAACLRECHRVLKVGGRLWVLEFSHPTSPWLQSVYDTYSFQVIPKLGKLFAQDADSYQYLVESIRRHPKQEALQAMFETAGFVDTRYENLQGGIVAIHEGAV